MASFAGKSFRVSPRPLLRWLAVLLVLWLALPAVADQAKNLYKKGQDAEVRQDYENAYYFYQQAYQLKPKELTYRASALRTRFLAAASHVRNGQLLRNAGKLEDALGEFAKALAIDPSSFIAQQEARRTQEMIEQARSGAPPTGPPAADSLGRLAASAQGPVELAPISNQPISLQLNEDSKVVYDAIGKLAGINVLFDPDYSSPRRIHIALNGVTLAQALEIAALESKTFWRPVTSNTIFVAQDTPTKRKELEQSVIKTFYLSNISQANELQEVINALRSILNMNQVSPMATQDAIVVRGTPDQVAMVEKLINDIDKPRPEVIVDVVVMEVSRNKLRDLGITPPASVSVQIQSPVTTTSTTTSGSSGSGGTATVTTGTTPQPLTLNQLANCGAECFTVSIPPATANFLFDDTATKIIQQPQVRSVDGEKASLKIGQRIPVATGSFQPGIGGVGINPLVNTQFQYQDVGVNIDITPRIHGDREVTLKIMLEISSVVGQQNIGGIQQPIIGQRKSEATIRLKEGEVNLMGGMLEQDLTKDWSGIPGLGQIPFFRYFFAKEHTTSTDSELVFALVPHIVRMQEVSGLNTRPVDVGTATGIELRPAQPAPAAAPVGAPPAAGPDAAAAAVAQIPTPVASPATQPSPAAAAPSPAQPQASAGQPGPTTSPSLRFDPPALTQAAGSTFVVNIVLTGGQDISSVPLQVSYNPSVLALVNLSDGGLLSKDGQPVALVHRDDAATGTLIMSASRPPNSPGISGDGAVFTLTFLAKAKGQSGLSISRPGARDAKMMPVTVTASGATVTVQ